MKTFVLMTKFSSQGAGVVEVGSKLQGRARTGRAWIEQIKQACPEVRFKSHYALLGQWDFMDIYDAPDEESAAKVSLISRSHGACQVESWLAIPYDKVLKIHEEIEQDQAEDS